jgi:hypothetical protein
VNVADVGRQRRFAVEPPAAVRAWAWKKPQQRRRRRQLHGYAPVLRPDYKTRKGEHAALPLVWRGLLDSGRGGWLSCWRDGFTDGRSSSSTRSRGCGGECLQPRGTTQPGTNAAGEHTPGLLPRCWCAHGVTTPSGSGRRRRGLKRPPERLEGSASFALGDLELVRGCDTCGA